jgi:hypothetical protein
MNSSVGDFATTVFQVISPRTIICEPNESRLTIANVNEKLDVLCSSKDWKNGTR